VVIDMEELTYLSGALKPIVDFELSVGNEIERIDRPAGTRCPLAVVFRRRLDFEGFEKMHGKPTGVEQWENLDRHYDLESGYTCVKTNHAIAGPTAR
jgi:hypothetical protein